MNQTCSLRAWCAMLAVGLAALAGSLSPSPRIATAESPTPRTRPAAADQAIARWTQRTTVAARDPEAWTSLGDAFMQKARETADPAYIRRAEAAYQKALGVAPRHGGALTGMAWVQGALHEFAESVEWARKALAVDPTDPGAHGLLGDAALELGDYDQAFERYQAMLDLRPDLAASSRAARLLWLTGDPRKATWMMGKAANAGAAYAEHTAWARAQLALMLWSQGALLPAEQVLEAALEASPGNHHVLAAMAKVKTAREDHAAAADLYRRALAVVPQLETVVALGDLYARMGQTAEAEKQYALVAVIDRLNRASGVRTDLEMARFSCDHDRDVARAAEEAETIARARKTVYAFDTLAWCAYKAGRDEDARTAVQQALARRTPDAEILFHAGMIHARLGDRATARRFLYQALSLNPHFHPTHATTAAETLARLGGAPAD